MRCFFDNYVAKAGASEPVASARAIKAPVVNAPMAASEADLVCDEVCDEESIDQINR